MPQETYDDFKLTFEIAIIEHLGLNLYSEVHAAISEMIANSYDADAEHVTVMLPVDEQLGGHDQTIVIKDDGHGMTYEEARDKYLKIGRNRRRSSRKSRGGKRTVIGKKGIGKLAGFGIAEQIRVRTVSSGKLTEFVLNLKDIRQAMPKDRSASVQDGAPDVTREYKPRVLHKDASTDEEDGTLVHLEQLRYLDAIDLDDFVRRLSRKFAIFGADFVVKVKSVGGEERTLARHQVPCQFRYPAEDGGTKNDGWEEDYVPTPRGGKRKVRYWVGFTKTTIKEDAYRGISVLANGKSVQEPFDFRVTGGVTGQFGLQYMTGEVEANWLDDSAVDVVASDRASVRWTDPDAAALLRWGQELVKDKLADWSKRRAQKTKDDIKDKYPEILEEIESYTGAAKKELERVVDHVVSALSQVGEKRRISVVRSIVQAYRHDYIRDLLLRIMNTTSRNPFEEFAKALEEWDIIDAVLTFQELTVKAEAIQTFDILIKGRATEVKSKSGDLSLHEHIAEHPWLISYEYSEMRSERNVDNYLLEEYGVDPDPRDKDGMRFDFVAIHSSERIELIEIKSAKDPIDKRGIDNLTEYRYRFSEAIKQRTKPRKLSAILIYNGKVKSGAESSMDALISNPDYEIYTWEEILSRNLTIYREQIERAKAKNPNDPRIVRLGDAAEKRRRVVNT
ncbi:MAG: ATP-binding protein [Bacteroidota bacterium]